MLFSEVLNSTIGVVSHTKHKSSFCIEIIISYVLCNLQRF